MARSASASSVGVLSRGHPLARPPIKASRTAGFRSALEGQDRGDRVDRPAPRVVLGDPRRDRDQQPSLRPAASATRQTP